MNILSKQSAPVLITGGFVSIVLYHLIEYYGSKYHIRQRFFNNFWGYLGPLVDKKLSKFKKELFSEAHGRVLDVGSGVGPTFKYLNNDTNRDSDKKRPPITNVVSIEPNPFMQQQLIEAANKSSNKFDIKILPKTIEQAYKDGDLENETFDTVICNLVLCSIPDQDTVLVDIQNLLKPGGKFLFIEHVCSDKILNRWFEHLINPLWSLIGDGCKLDRVTDEKIKHMAGWEKVSISQIKIKQPFKHIYGIAIKESLK
ncbi:hypothetical protein RB653_000502 [Dictyostelium firmibasis]|uniref:Methyltransferase type 11 domain-containing protein n=1 Tax=Dictyostelium firmibasis TaxID=79012 RepID=A0AAN7TVB9_9MYCE